MASVSLLNPKAEIARAAQAQAININAAKALQDLMSSNLGPKGTTKMLVSGGGDIKITKDGNVLLHEMCIKNPTAAMIARASTAQDDATGDGTTSTVLLIGELLRQAELPMSEGLHPRLLTEGIMRGRDQCNELLEAIKLPLEMDRQSLLPVAHTSLRTKLAAQFADLLTDICVDAVLAIRRDDSQHFLDLNMIELMDMLQFTHMDTKLVDGLVLDHGGRHVNMPKRLERAFILTCNVSLELEKTTVTSVFCYNTAEAREACALAEHEFIDQRVQKIIELKRQVCQDNDHSFVVINQQGIDVPSLEALAAEGILALRRAKRRNMERLARACGGQAMHSLEQLLPEHLGYAGLVHEQQLGETKYTFVEQCRHPASVTILIRGQTKHQIGTIKDAIRDGLHAVYNALQDGCVVPGAASFELRAHQQLLEFKHEVKGKAQLGVQLFADALLVIPKALARNSGFDVQDTILLLTEAARLNSDQLVGLDIASGQTLLPAEHGIFDNYCVKKQIINSCSIIACNLLLTDEIMRAGLTSLSG